MRDGRRWRVRARVCVRGRGGGGGAQKRGAESVFCWPSPPLTPLCPNARPPLPRPLTIQPMDDPSLADDPPAPAHTGAPAAAAALPVPPAVAVALAAGLLILLLGERARERG